MSEQSLNELKDKWSTYEHYRGELQICQSMRVLMNVSAIGCAAVSGCAQILPQAIRQPDETIMFALAMSAIYISQYFKKYEIDSHAMVQKLEMDLNKRLRYCLSLRHQTDFDTHHINIDVRSQPFNPYVYDDISENETLPQQPTVVRCVRTVSKYAAETVAFLSHLLS